MNKDKKSVTKSKISNIGYFIADNFYDSHYTIEKYSKSHYRFGFGVKESSDIPSMFTGSSVDEAMYRAIDSELIKEAKAIEGCDATSRRELRNLAQKSQQKCEELAKEISNFKQDQEHIMNVIDRFRGQWKDNTIMGSLEEKIGVWKEKNLSLFVAFLLEYIEKQASQLDMISGDIVPLRKVEKELKGIKILATFHTGKVFEPIWNEIRDIILDGKWHIYPEIENIIMKYYDYNLSANAVRQKRQSYFYFVRDKRYREARGGKDYLFEWKRRGGRNRFRFVVKRESNKSAGAGIDTVNKHSICEAVNEEFVALLCDGEYHTYQEAIELFKRYNKYKKYKKKESFYPLIRAYMEYVGKSYQITKTRGSSGIHKFKFDSIRHKLDMVPSKNVEKEKEVLKIKQVKIDTVDKHPIYKDVSSKFVSLFCDGKYHVYPEVFKMFKQYDNYKNYKNESLYPIVHMYMTHVNKIYGMRTTKTREGLINKFRFDKELGGTLVTVENSKKCARCGRIIQYGKKCMQVDNMFYHLDCYNILNSQAK